MASSSSRQLGKELPQNGPEEPAATDIAGSSGATVCFPSAPAKEGTVRELPSQLQPAATQAGDVYKTSRSMASNTTKSQEYGREGGEQPPEGDHRECPALVTASSVQEGTRSAKVSLK